jgi:hypothetical protein
MSSTPASPTGGAGARRKGKQLLLIPVSGSPVGPAAVDI